LDKQVFIAHFFLLLGRREILECFLQDGETGEEGLAKERLEGKPAFKKKFIIPLGAAFVGIIALVLASSPNPSTFLAEAVPDTNSVTITAGDYVAADHAFKKNGLVMPVTSYLVDGINKIDCSGSSINLTIVNDYSPFISSPFSELTGNINGRRGNGQYSAGMSGVSHNQSGNVMVYLEIGTDANIVYGTHKWSRYVTNGSDIALTCLKDCYNNLINEPADRVRSRFPFYYEGVSSGATVSLSSITFTWACTAAS
jgi:hypothetical protein